VTHSAPARPEVYRIMKRLFAPAESGEVPAVFALLDAARDERILPMIRRSRLDYCCLFLGALAPVLAEAAPYLVDISPRAPFTREILELGWGESWGIFVRAQQVILQDLRRHFRKLLLVEDESQAGCKRFFRFYDPRVLRVYFPTCTWEELRFVLGPVTRYCMEGEEAGVLLEYSLRPSGPVRQVVRLGS